MPHLSPMNWLLAPVLFLLISIPMLISTLWWSQSLNFPTINFTSASKSLNSWTWSW